jgi:ferredoxin
MLTVTVVHHSSGKAADFLASPDEPLLDQMDEVCPFEIPSLCWNGACGTCALRVTDGLEHLETDAFGIGCSTEVEPGWILPCAAAPSPTAAACNEVHRVTVEVS